MESALEPRSKSFRRCCSTPTLSFLAPEPERDESDQLQVYVVARPFQEFGGPIMKRLPDEYKGFAVNIGVCHFMTVFKTKNGELIQFDFGPQGGRDVHANGGPLSWLLRDEKESNQQISRRLSYVPGEIREVKLLELPSAHVYMGKSRISLEDIRSFNGIQCMQYELHKHDCRHYVNNLVQYTTGVSGASIKFVKDYYRSQGEKIPPIGSTFVGLLQNVTDASNWSKVKASGKATVAACLYLAGSGVARTRASVQIPPRPVKRAAMTALASVAASCPEIPMVQSAAALGSMVSEGAKKVTTGTMTFVEAASRNVSRSIVPQRSNSAVAMASAMTRGAVGLVAKPLKVVPQKSGEIFGRLPWLGQPGRNFVKTNASTQGASASLTNSSQRNV